MGSSEKCIPMNFCIWVNNDQIVWFGSWSAGIYWTLLRSTVFSASLTRYIWAMALFFWKMAMCRQACWRRYSPYIRMSHLINSPAAVFFVPACIGVFFVHSFVGVWFTQRGTGSNSRLKCISHSKRKILNNDLMEVWEWDIILYESILVEYFTISFFMKPFLLFQISSE